ncbi:MAG TPA: hypothetical protein VNM91_10120 [Dehalococcoidia bacterium]|nr:hypothetical protein [Dehalococcoidia bacterium]
MAVAATQISLLERADGRALSSVLRDHARHLPIAAVLALVVGIHIPTLDHFFFGDDFVVLDDIRTRSFSAYATDVVLLRDITPNWRPLTMLVYWGEFQLFGFDAMAWRIVNLAAHVATVLVLYAVVLTMTRRLFVAVAAALVFGVTASAVHTVTYITALPHVLSQLFLLSSLGLLHLYVRSDERSQRWYWGALALFIAGFLANEGGVVFAGVLFAYYFVESFLRRRDLLDAVAKMLPFAIVSVLLVGSLGGCGCQGVENGFYGLGWHIPREYFVYMSRLAWPVGPIPLDPTALEWTVGAVVIAVALFFIIRGPDVARVAAVGMLLGVTPYVPGKIWTASRYTYMATPFFAVLAAVGAGFVFHQLLRLWRPAAYGLGAAALLAAAGLYSWQYIDQTQPFLDDTERWEQLVAGLQEHYPEVPAGSTVYVVEEEGRWSNPFWYGWLQSVSRSVYGEGVRLMALPADHLLALERSRSEPAYYLKLEDGELVALAPYEVKLLQPRD